MPFFLGKDIFCKGHRCFICLRFEKQHRLRSKVQISKTSKALTAQYCRNVNNFMFLLERRKREKNCENVRISFSGGTPQQLTFWHESWERKKTSLRRRAWRWCRQQKWKNYKLRPLRCQHIRYLTSMHHSRNSVLT